MVPKIKSDKMNRFKFGGLIKTDWDDGDKIYLVQDDGTKIDLIKRFASIDELSRYSGMQVNYHISDTLLTERELKEELIRRISGDVTAEYTSESYHYSSWTSGTDYYSTLTVGGHNLFSEIGGFEGKYVFFEIITKDITS
jgi:hypothetical protein